MWVVWYQSLRKLEHLSAVKHTAHIVSELKLTRLYSQVMSLYSKEHILKQHYLDIGVLCSLVPPTVSECNIAVIITDPRSVTVCQT